MSKSELSRRHIQGDKTRTMNIPNPPPKIKPQTVTWNDIPAWQRDNEYILTGYRPSTSYAATLSSLTFLHNETCNIYTHLLGALILLFIALFFLRHLSNLESPTVSATDYLMFLIFFSSAKFCLLCSTAFHLLGAHSQPAEQFWHRMDLLGIVGVTVGTFVPGIYYVFGCEPSLQHLHWSIVSFSQIDYFGGVI